MRYPGIRVRNPLILGTPFFVKSIGNDAFLRSRLDCGVTLARTQRPAHRCCYIIRGAEAHMSIYYTHGPVYSTGEQIAVGDWVKVFVPKLGVWHHGSVRLIYPAAGGLAVNVAHNRKESGVTVSDWYDFADGNVVLLERHAYSAAHAREIVARVDASVGKPYHLFAQNCEHFASFAFTGKAESKSVQFVGGAAVLGILAVWLFGG
jgi:hypothetical protein